MRIILLGPDRQDFIAFLRSFADTVRRWDAPLTGEEDILDNVDFIISYGYRYILRKTIIDRYLNRIINLHISLLPWNRGADPNLWSFLEDTPRGVTIHYMDYGIDTGPILAQKEVYFDDNDTLRTSYDRLSNTIEILFYEVWPQIRGGRITAQEQVSGGTFHLAKDRQAYQHLLIDGYDTKVNKLFGKALLPREGV